MFVATPEAPLVALASFPVAGRPDPPFDAGLDDRPGGPLSVRIVPALDAVAYLRDQKDQWRQLAAQALETNPFYEPELCLSALEAWGAAAQIDVVVIDAPRRKWASGPRVMCGFFPVAKTRHAGQSCLTLWRHDHCYLTTPLLRKETAREALTTLLDFLGGPEVEASLLRMEMTPGEGPFHKLLVEVLHSRQQSHALLDCYTRAFFIRSESENQFLQDSLSRKRRHELNRQLRRLEEKHHVTFRQLSPDELVDPWIDAFLKLESSGWKRGRETALACQTEDEQFFRNTLRRNHDAGRLMMLAMELDQHVVAMKCNLLAGRGGYALKIAYDEAFAEFSPGALLEIENIRRLHQLPSTVWMDSCAMPNHSLINPLWPDRRIIQTMLVSTGTTRGNLAVAATPLLKWTRDAVRSLAARQTTPSRRQHAPLRKTSP